MTKQEFLEGLERHLRGQLSENQIRRHVEYYREYIDKEVTTGKSETEVMGMLGDPWLIAKTLIDSDAWETSNSGETFVHGDEEFMDEEHGKVKKLDLTTWYGKLGVILIAAAALFLLFTIVSALIPVVIVLAIVGVIVRAFRKR